MVTHDSTFLWWNVNLFVGRRANGMPSEWGTKNHTVFKYNEINKLILMILVYQTLTTPSKPTRYTGYTDYVNYINYTDYSDCIEYID